MTAAALTDDSTLQNMGPAEPHPLTGINSYRSWIEIAARILQVSRQPSGEIKTHVMYRANLTYGQLGKYLQYLTDRGLLENVNDRYRTTSKGFNFLAQYSQLQGYLNDVNV
jgi:predicted transcriptional regulator